MNTPDPALRWLPDDYTVLRTETAPLPEHDGFRAVLSDDTGTTVVARNSQLADRPGDVRSGPWRMLRMDGPLPHDAVGILARLAGVLANAAVPIFALSTFDTDYVLVPTPRAADAHRALVDAGYSIHNSP